MLLEEVSKSVQVLFNGIEAVMHSTDFANSEIASLYIWTRSSTMIFDVSGFTSMRASAVR